MNFRERWFMEMVLWVVRHGRQGQFENYALENDIVTIDWRTLPDMSDIGDKRELKEHILSVYPNKKQPKVIESYCVSHNNSAN